MGTLIYGFGAAMAAADVDGDGDDDLAIGGVRALDASSFYGGAAVVVLLGAPGGLSTAGSRLLWQNTPGIPGVDEPGDLFGSNLSSADFDESGEDDLAIAHEGEAFSGNENAGMVTVLYGDVGGPTTIGAQRWSQDSPGVRGVAEDQDRFGTGLSPMSASFD
jgi:hypothetical protein